MMIMAVVSIIVVNVVVRYASFKTIAFSHCARALRTYVYRQKKYKVKLKATKNLN